MWIIPKSLQSNGALAQVEIISDSAASSQICASSLLVRSKPTPARTWSQKWKRASWTRHLSGRIAAPSPATTSSIASYFSSLPIHASPSATPACGSASAIPGTSGPTSAVPLQLCGHCVSFSKTSRGTYPKVSKMSSATWKRLVTAMRKEYLARRNAARAIAANASSSSGNWPTPKALTGGGNSQRENRPQTGGPDLHEAASMWVTPKASDGEKGGPNQAGSKGDMMLPSMAAVWPTPSVDGLHNRLSLSSTSGDGLSTATKQWPTPAGRDYKGTNSDLHCTETGGGRKHMDQLPNFVSQSSHPAPAWVDMACLIKLPTFTLQTLRELGVVLKQSLQTPSHGNASSKSTRVLNPRFVEWLMGWPIGWTDCDSPATESSPTPQLSPG